MKGYHTSIGAFMPQKQFLVPRYQRNYDWATESVEDLLSDLRFCTKNQKSLFLGTFTFKVYGDKKDEYDIIDGQQRLTTLVILSLALKVIFMERTAENADSHITQQLIPAINNLFINILDSQGNVRGPKLKSAISIRDFLEKICLNLDFDMKNYPTSDQKGAADARKVKRYIKHFYEELIDVKTSDLKEIWAAIQNCGMLVTEVNSDEEAFYLFEVLNARGKELETGDLLKNNIFSQGKDEKHYDKLVNDWDEIVSNLKSPKDLVPMLRHWYFTKNGFVTKNDLYRKTKDLTKELKMSPDDFCVELFDYSLWQKELSSGTRASFKEMLFDEFLSRKYKAKDYQDHADRLYNSLSALKLFNYGPVFPLLFSYFKKIQELIAEKIYVRKKKNDKLIQNMEVLLEKLEIFHFINYKVGEQKVTVIENLFSEYAKEYTGCSDMKEVEKTTNDLLDKIEKLLESRSDFLLKFQTIKYQRSKDKKALIRYIFNKFNISRTAKGKNTDSLIYDYDSSKDPSIEHWAPVTTPSDPNYAPIHINLSEDAINSIGNLAVLTSDQNASLGNRSPTEKADQLAVDLNAGKITLHAFVNDFLNTYKNDFPKWNEKNIEDRAKKLSIEGYDEVWKF
tara:strand:+ start:280 stop:2145 length:1866 start_codon:yes stop_codon:yes gene_type:complete